MGHCGDSTIHRHRGFLIDGTLSARYFWASDLSTRASGGTYRAAGRVDPVAVVVDCGGGHINLYW